MDGITVLIMLSIAILALLIFIIFRSSQVDQTKKTDESLTILDRSFERQETKLNDLADQLIEFNKPLDKTKQLFKDTESFSSIDIKEFCLLYIIVNNLNFFYQRSDLLENVKFFKKENRMIFTKILECLKSGNLDTLQIDNQLLDQIEKYANIKHIVHKNDKDESKIVEIFNDIKNELKTHDLELRIQELESKFAEDFNQNTFDEINRLKKEQNIN